MTAVLADPVEPFFVGFKAEDKHGVVWKWDTLGCSLWASVL